MPALPIDENGKKEESLYKRPVGVLLDEKQWLFLKKRYNLTPRELQVAILICRGFSNDEVAKSLKMKHGTVKTHLRNIYRRTRVKSKILLLLRFAEDINKYYETSQQTVPAAGKVSEEVEETISKISQKK